MSIEFQIREKLSVIYQMGQFLEKNPSIYNPELLKEYGEELQYECTTIFPLFEQLSNKRRDIQRREILLREELREEMHNCDIFENSIFGKGGWQEMYLSLKEENRKLKDDLRNSTERKINL